MLDSYFENDNKSLLPKIKKSPCVRMGIKANMLGEILSSKRLLRD